jgi:hypothetical protein
VDDVRDEWRVVVFEPLVRGERHRSRGRAVVAPPKREQPVAAGVVLCELDRRLDRVAAGRAAKDDAILPAEPRWGDLVELLDEPEPRLRREVDRVDELLALVANGLHHVRVRVADVQHADASEHVDVRVAVGVADRRPLPGLERDRNVFGIRHRAAVYRSLRLEELTALRAGHVSDRRRVVEVDRIDRRSCGHTARDGDDR